MTPEGISEGIPTQAKGRLEWGTRLEVWQRLPQPIFQPQVDDTSEFSFVVGDKDVAEGKRLGGDEQIIGADQSPGLLKPGPQRSVTGIGRCLERQDRNRTKQTRALNQAGRRNLRRFPPDFMFQMNQSEFENWKSQIVISKKEKMGLRRTPLVFSEQGVAMLSSVLNSERAVQVNIIMMRAFVRLREWLSAHKDLAHKLNELERKYEKHEVEIQAVFSAIRKLIDTPPKPRRPIGFEPPKK